MLNICIPYDSVIPVLCIYPKEMCTYALKDMFKNVEALFIKVKNWKQPIYMQQWNGIHKLQDIYITEYNITKRKKLVHTATCVQNIKIV